MYIYNFDEAKKTSTRFDVSKQICVKCAIEHANNTLDNSVLTDEMQEFIQNNKQIISNLHNNDVLFSTTTTNTLVLYKNLQPLTRDEYYNLLELSNIVFPKLNIIGQGYVNPHFHNHNNSEIHIQLDNKESLFTLS